MNYKICPNNVPQMSRERIEELIKPFNVDRQKYPILIVGIRGYYLNTMGEIGKNDRGIYDDAIFIHTTQIFRSYNANTDPSRYRKGNGKSQNTKGMARLNAGIWYAHNLGNHKGQYLALVQDSGEVTVTRDGNPDYLDKGDFGINIHRGAYLGTSSLGCQTIFPDQWKDFIKNVEQQAIKLFGAQKNSRVIPYILIENINNNVFKQ